MKFTITKVRRGCWQVAPASGSAYITIILATDYDHKGEWVHGWHLRVRDFCSGAVKAHGQCFATRDLAIAGAMASLGLIYENRVA